MDIPNAKERLKESNRLLAEKTTSAQKLESLKVILKGINPRLDKVLDDAATAFSKIEKLQRGEVVQLTVESLPQDSEEEKRRKKAILAFIKRWEDLKSEVERVEKELSSEKDLKQQIQSIGKIASLAKGPFGLITIAAVLIVGFFTITNLDKIGNSQNDPIQSKNQTQTPPASDKIKIIIYNGKKIPLSELKVSQGTECDKSSHYHAINHTAKALDGSFIEDPGGCGYGKTKDVAIVDSD